MDDLETKEKLAQEGIAALGERGLVLTDTAKTIVQNRLNERADELKEAGQDPDSKEVRSDLTEFARAVFASTVLDLLSPDSSAGVTELTQAAEEPSQQEAAEDVSSQEAPKSQGSLGSEPQVSEGSEGSEEPDEQSPAEKPPDDQEATETDPDVEPETESESEPEPPKEEGPREGLERGFGEPTQKGGSKEGVDVAESDSGFEGVLDLVEHTKIEGSSRRSVDQVLELVQARRYEAESGLPIGRGLIVVVDQEKSELNSFSLDKSLLDGLDTLLQSRRFLHKKFSLTQPTEVERIRALGEVLEETKREFEQIKAIAASLPKTPKELQEGGEKDEQ